MAAVPFPVMHVRVDNDGFFHRAIRLQLSNRYRYVMNRAESLPMLRMRMMKSPAQIRAEPVAQRRLRGKNRSASREPHCLDQFLRIWHFRSITSLAVSVPVFSLLTHSGM